MTTPSALPFDEFWHWLTSHPNCILRAGTPEAVVFDDEDLHWYLGAEQDGLLVVQVLRGKRLMGELLISPEQVAYVESRPGDHEDEHLFELITETETDRMAAYFFILAHGYEERDEPTGSLRVH